MDLATFSRFSPRTFPSYKKVKSVFHSLRVKTLNPLPHDCDRHKTFQHIEIGSTIYLF